MCKFVYKVRISETFDYRNFYNHNFSGPRIDYCRFENDLENVWICNYFGPENMTYMRDRNHTDTYCYNDSISHNPESRDSRDRIHYFNYMVRARNPKEAVKKAIKDWRKHYA